MDDAIARDLIEALLAIESRLAERNTLVEFQGPDGAVYINPDRVEFVRHNYGYDLTEITPAQPGQLYFVYGSPEEVATRLGAVVKMPPGPEENQ